MNEVALLRQLHLHGHSSRVELAAILKLDTKTVTNLTRDLLKKRYIKACGLAPLDRGRPRQMLQLNSRVLQAIGIYLKEDAVHGAVIDLEGRIRHKISAPIFGEGSHKALLQTLRKIADQLLRQSKVKVMGIGLAFPGIYDTQTQRIIECAHLPAWKGVCIPDVFQGVYQGPFFFDTFTRAKALAEQWYGAARALENFILVDAGVGIGCAIVNQGQLQTGATHLAGEIGHIIIDRQGLPCRCGRRGCLETVSSLEPVRRHMQQITGQTRQRLPVPAMAALLTRDNPAIRAAVTEAGQTLGLALANLVQVLNPAHIVLAGDMVELGPLFIQSVNEGLTEYSIPTFRHAVRVIPGTLGENGALLGAGILALQSLFSS
ncbi:MAG: ROK family protein [Verrucomicrobia bacterium]|nr:ROK family protein [Verrucomicrobiota bacterium]